MTTIRRLCTLIAMSAASVLAAIATGTAAFAQTPPEPVGSTAGGVDATVGHIGTVSGSGGMLGWEIALIAVGAALVAALLTAGVDRFSFYRRLAHDAV